MYGWQWGADHNKREYFSACMTSRLVLDRIQRSVKFDQADIHARDLTFEAKECKEGMSKL